MQEESDDKLIYQVVINHEEQYSIWPADQECPKGWTSVGKAAPKGECLAYIRDVWTDMRPLSLRKQMAAAEARQTTTSGV
jgi:MbtH protein